MVNDQRPGVCSMNLNYLEPKEEILYPPYGWSFLTNPLIYEYLVNRMMYLVYCQFITSNEYKIIVIEVVTVVVVWRDSRNAKKEVQT